MRTLPILALRGGVGPTLQSPALMAAPPEPADNSLATWWSENKTLLIAVRARTAGTLRPVSRSKRQRRP